VDSVIPQKGGGIIAIEARWKADVFSPEGLRALSRRYPEASCYAVI